MSAPQIPNLSTFRRGGGRGRGRGPGGPGGTAAIHHVPQVDKDKIIQGTDVDAATSRLSAVECGYLDDPFAKHILPGGHAERRLPLMNRGTLITFAQRKHWNLLIRTPGTWARTTAIDLLVDKFITSRTNTPASLRRQIISLGAGSDTRFLRLKQKYPDDDLLYHEIDFPANTAAKIRQLESRPLRKIVQELCGFDFVFQDADFSRDCTTVISTTPPGYFIHSHDLRNLPLKSEALKWIETGVPTLLISECCLIYLAPEHADAVLQYFTRLFPSSTPLGIVIYEPIRPRDAFGRTMVANLTARGIHLQTLEANATLGMQRERLGRFGFGLAGEEDKEHDEHGEKANTDESGVGAIDLDYMWSSWVDDREKERVVELEWMDEVEEWILLMKHYCVAWGWRDRSGKASDGDRVFEGWKRVQSQESED